MISFPELYTTLVIISCSTFSIYFFVYFAHFQHELIESLIQFLFPGILFTFLWAERPGNAFHKPTHVGSAQEVDRNIPTTSQGNSTRVFEQVNYVQTLVYLYTYVHQTPQKNAVMQDLAPLRNSDNYMWMDGGHIQKFKPGVLDRSCYSRDEDSERVSK